MCDGRVEVTIVVLWYREKIDELWCASDSRISNDTTTLTDSGAKIFPISVHCQTLNKLGEWEEFGVFKFGFAYAGSTLSALNSLALSSACTQNLCMKNGTKEPPSLESIVNLFQKISEYYIRDISSRNIGSESNINQYFFESFIFGFCPKEKEYRAFALKPKIDKGSFLLQKEIVNVKPLTFYPIGSGTSSFVNLSRELDNTHPDPGVLSTLKELLNRETIRDVGGYFQIGVSSRKGFNLIPILDDAGEGNCNVSFLGWDVAKIGSGENFTIGPRAIELTGRHPRN
jgi:hypothetical protein